MEELWGLPIEKSLKWTLEISTSLSLCGGSVRGGGGGGGGEVSRNPVREVRIYFRPCFTCLIEGQF